MKTSAKSAKSFLIPATAIFGVAEMLWAVWSGVHRGIWVDSDVYAMGGRIVQQGGDLYAGLSDTGLPFTYSPFAAVMFVPLSMLEPTTGRTAFTVVSLLCYLLVIAVVSRRLRLPVWKIIIIGGIGLAFEPMERNLLLGQINLVLMALVVCDWLLVPPRYRGYLTGIAVGIKITPAAFVALAVVQRNWAVVGRSALGFLATALAGWVLLPDASRSYWGGGFMGLGKFGPGVIGTDNQSLLASWMRLTGTMTPSTTMQILALVIGMGLGVGAALLELRRARPDFEVAALAWIALGGLLASPISWSHHWVWFTLPLALLLSRGRYVQVGLMSLVMWYPTIWLNYRKMPDALILSPQQRIVSCVYSIFALGLLLSALLDRRRPDAEVPSFTPAATPQSARQPHALTTSPSVP